MTKPISDYTVDELSKKIEAIKAERERTANALKRYEEELERRKQEVPLGVPLKLKEGIEKGFYLQPALSVSCGNVGVGSQLDVSLGVFHSEESAEKHAEMLLAWRRALVTNAKGEPIDIKVLLPLLKKGWVAYERYYGWVWFKNKPFILRGTDEDATWSNEGSYSIIGGFNIKPSDDWRNSLMECGI